MYFRNPTSALEAALKPRRYVHFDAPLSASACKALVQNPAAVKSHSFLPFLRHDIIRTRIKRIGPKCLKKSTKVREIRYAAHSDAAIYSYYNYLIAEKYEKIVHDQNLSESVIAFRSLKKSNIDFAHESFQWIAKNQPCVALGFDVKDFFGTLDHKLLKKQWAHVLGNAILPDDHFAIFRSLTRHASVELISARNALKLSRQQLKRIERLCAPTDFRSKIRNGGLITSNPKSHGIPQGSPISALLSNIYMLPFDIALTKVTDEIGGLYKRYCDDILVVVPTEYADDIKNFVTDELVSIELKLQTSKTLECTFDPNADKPLQYLGLIFDGQKTTLRPSGISLYYAKMRHGVNLHKRAKRRDGSTPILKQRRKYLVRQYTENAPNKHRNYFNYVRRAAEKTGSPAITRQLRRHTKAFKKVVLAP